MYMCVSAPACACFHLRVCVSVRGTFMDLYVRAYVYGHGPKINHKVDLTHYQRSHEDVCHEL